VLDFSLCNLLNCPPLSSSTLLFSFVYYPISSSAQFLNFNFNYLKVKLVELMNVFPAAFDEGLFVNQKIDFMHDSLQIYDLYNILIAIWLKITSNLYYFDIRTYSLVFMQWTFKFYKNIIIKIPP